MFSKSKKGEKKLKKVLASLKNLKKEKITNLFPSLKSRAEALLLALIEKGDPETYMLINFAEDGIHVSVASVGTVSYAHALLDFHDVGDLHRELKKHFVQWHTKKNDFNELNPKIKKIILAGEHDSLEGIAEYLAVNLKHPVELGDPWINVIDTEKFVPEITLNESLRFAPHIGLALKNLD